MQIHVSFLPKTPLPSRLSHNIEQSLQCCVSFRCIKQSDSVMHAYISMFFRLFMLIGYYKKSSIVPCAIQ